MAQPCLPIKGISTLQSYHLLFSSKVTTGRLHNVNVQHTGHSSLHHGQVPFYSNHDGHRVQVTLKYHHQLKDLYSVFFLSVPIIVQLVEAASLRNQRELAWGEWATARSPIYSLHPSVSRQSISSGSAVVETTEGRGKSELSLYRFAAPGAWKHLGQIAVSSAVVPARGSALAQLWSDIPSAREYEAEHCAQRVRIPYTGRLDSIHVGDDYILLHTADHVSASSFRFIQRITVHCLRLNEWKLS